jgi:hypothetical protein
VSVNSIIHCGSKSTHAENAPSSKTNLNFPPVAATLPAMSTVTEIESAIARLPAPDLARLAAWLDEFRHRRQTSATGPHHDLDALVGTWREDPAFDSAMRAFEQVDAAVWK